MKRIFTRLVFVMGFSVSLGYAATELEDAAASLEKAAMDLEKAAAEVKRASDHAIKVARKALAEAGAEAAPAEKAAPPRKKVAAKPRRAKADTAALQLEALKELFPEGIMDAHGKPADLDKLSGKAVGVYFSAHWCPPCRTFTPKLVKYRDENQDHFEVVFVSSDRTPEAHKEYMEEAEMKWYTLKHRGEDSAALSKKYGVRGIPTLVILRSDGSFLTSMGRQIVDDSMDAAMLADPAVAVETGDIEREYNGRTFRSNGIKRLYTAGE